MFVSTFRSGVHSIQNNIFNMIDGIQAVKPYFLSGDPYYKTQLEKAALAGLKFFAGIGLLYGLRSYAPQLHIGKVVINTFFALLGHDAYKASTCGKIDAYTKANLLSNLNIFFSARSNSECPNLFSYPYSLESRELTFFAPTYRRYQAQFFKIVTALQK